MLASHFRFDLPDGQIAQRPLADRSASRMLLVDGRDGWFENHGFTDLPSLVRPGDVLVFNDTRVIPARLLGRKESGGQVEVLVERITAADRALCHVRASKSPKPGTRLIMEDAVELVCEGRDGDLFDLRLAGAGGFLQVLEASGRMPLPPYIERAAEPGDSERYQTCYAREPGAVAAPTAGLHFDDVTLDGLRQAGVETAFVTLHVGAGTFQPLRVDDVDDHHMHSERVEVTQATCDQVNAARARGGRVIAVGTTSVRCLEAATVDGRLEPYRGETDIFIRPGYRFRMTDALLTNFHLPESTLLMLVTAFGGYDTVMAAYRFAVDEGYRFFSYGDCMFLQSRALPGEGMPRDP
ncbi:MAG: tRNA preQ1(34) S-adenosylmethionine ribosyltransferase-isomerase QueA [Gammaproteobacteria bacterium]